MSEIIPTADAGGTAPSDERVGQYLGGRYGMKGDTQQRYGAAVRDFESIRLLEQTSADIARNHGLGPEAFCNHLKRHHMEVLQLREELRFKLGITKKRKGGATATLSQKYAPAVRLLRETDVTIREAAERTGVGLSALQHYIIYYQKDLAEERLKRRLSRLDKPCRPGELNASGNISKPRDTAEYYAEAVELYRTTDLTVKDIAARCRLVPHNLERHLQRWHVDLVSVRRERRREAAADRQQKALSRPTRKEKAANKYIPALALIEQGKTYAEAAGEVGVPNDRLQWWVRHNHPQIHERAIENCWVTLPSGKRLKRETWQVYQQAVNAFTKTNESVRHIARRLGVKANHLGDFLRENCPEAAERRRGQK